LYGSFVKQYVAGFFENLLKRRALVRLIKVRLMSPLLSDALFKVFARLRFVQRQVKGHFNLREFINVLWVTFFSKNVEVLRD